MGWNRFFQNKAVYHLAPSDKALETKHQAQRHACPVRSCLKQPYTDAYTR